MAERRMFAKTIIDSDDFLDMPLSAQALYFHLSMRADDEGFINNPKKIQRMVGASDDDCKLLVMKRFILTFESGVIVIKHWRIHNYIRNDRFKETIYVKEKATLALNENHAYTEKVDGRQPFGIPSDNQVGDSWDTQDRLGKVRLDKKESNTCVLPKKKESATRFQPPTVEEVSAYCEERNNTVDAQRFVDYYTANGWKVGKNAMKDWKAAVRTWERSDVPKATVADDDMGFNGLNYFKRVAERLKAREQGYDGECIDEYAGDDVSYLPLDV